MGSESQLSSWLTLEKLVDIQNKLQTIHNMLVCIPNFYLIQFTTDGILKDSDVFCIIESGVIIRQ